MRLCGRARLSDHPIQIGPTGIPPDRESGSVRDGKKKTERTAEGEKKNKKGDQSYHPLYDMAARTGEFFDVLHRAGSVHDSDGARSYSSARLARVRTILPNCKHRGRCVLRLTDVGA